jgi:hypothetical protein
MQSQIQTESQRASVAGRLCQPSVEALLQLHLPVALLALAVFAFLCYIWAFGVNVPFWDEWELLDRFRHFMTGRYSLLELAREKHNEHLIGAGFAYMMIHHLLTGFDGKAILISDGVLQIALMSIVLRFVWRGMPEGPRRSWLLLPAALSLLSLAQFQNLLWGFQAPWFLIGLALVAALLALDLAYRASTESVRTRLAAVSAILAFFSSFCSFHGLIVWVAGAVFILVRNEMRAGRALRDARARIWLVGAVVCLVSYVVLYVQTPAGGPTGGSAFASLAQPQRLLLFITLNLGNVLIGTSNAVAFGAGLFVLAATLIAVWKAIGAANRGPHAFALALIAFEVTFALLAAAGRVSLGIGMSRESHYTAYVPLLLVGDYMILVGGNGSSGKWVRLTGVVKVLLGVFLALFVVVSTYRGIVSGYDWRARRGVAAAVLLDYQQASAFEIESTLFGDAPFVVRGADFLKTRRFSTFRAGAAAVPEDAMAYVTVPDTWNELIRNNPDQREALQRLWEVYGAGRDLQIAFEPTSKTFARDLVTWAFGATREQGDHYLRRYLLPYAQDYAALRERLPKD